MRNEKKIEVKQKNFINEPYRILERKEIEDKIEERDTSVKENVNLKVIQVQRIQEIWDSMQRSNL